MSLPQMREAITALPQIPWLDFKGHFPAGERGEREGRGEERKKKDRTGSRKTALGNKFLVTA